MAKLINLNNMPLATSGLKLSKNISIEEIEEHPFFKELYNIDPVLLERITKSMEKDGFDASQPVHIWITTGEDEIPHKYLFDGYTRVAAARAAGIKIIPYFEHKFETQDEAYMYALHLQVDRRNLSEQELIDNIEKLMGTEYVQNCIGRKSEVIADTLGISARKVQQALSVINDATDEQKEEIASGAKSINKIYKENHPTKKEKKEDSEEIGNAAGWTAEPSEYADDFDDDSDDTETISDALDDTSGDPKGLSISDHSDHIERPSYKMSAKEDSERTKERHEAYESGFVEGFTKAVNYVLCQKLKNATAKSIYKAVFCTSELTKEFLDTFEPDEKGMGYYTTLRNEIIRDENLTDYNELPVEETEDDTNDSAPETDEGFDIGDIDFAEGE